MPRELSVVTTDLAGNQRRLENPLGLRFGANYPGGYASCSFRIQRPLHAAYPQGIGPFYGLAINRGYALAWEGEIRSVQQAQDSAEWLEVTGFGKGVILRDAPYNRIWQSVDLSQWITEAPAGYENFDFEITVQSDSATQDKIFWKPKLGESYYTSGDGASCLWKLPATAHHPAHIAKISGTLTYNLGNTSGHSGSWRLVCYALDDAGAEIAEGAGEVNPLVIASSGKATSSAWSWATPAGTRQLRLAMEATANQAQGPGHIQEGSSNAAWYRLQDVAGMANNMILNPSFESWDALSQVADNWVNYGVAPTLSALRTEAGWRTHLYSAMRMLSNDIDSGVRSSPAVACLANTTYYLSVWGKADNATVWRLLADDGAGGNLQTIASSDGSTNAQQLAGTYVTGAAQVTLSVILVIVSSTFTVDFDQVWCYTAAEPNPTQDYAVHSWRTANNDTDNNFRNDGGAMMFQERAVIYGYEAGPPIETSADYAGWRAIVHWVGTGITFYGMKGRNFGQASFQTYDDTGASVDGPTTVDEYGDPASFGNQLYSVSGLTRSRHYTVITVLLTHSQAITEALKGRFGYNIDYWVVAGYTFFPATLEEVSATLVSTTVATTTAASVTCDDVAADIVSILSAAAYGLSSITALIATGSTRNLLPLTILDDEEAETVLNRVLGAGDQNNTALSWAVWDDAKLTTEAVPLSSIGYYLRPEQAKGISLDADWSDIVLEVYGKYTGADGRVVRTSKAVSAESADTYGGRKRTVALGVDEQTLRIGDPRKGTTVQVNDAGGTYLGAFLAEQDAPQNRATITIQRGILNADGTPVPLALVRPGKLLQILRFGAPDSGSDLRDGKTTFMVKATKYDAETASLSITLGGDHYSLAEMLLRNK